MTKTRYIYHNLRKLFVGCKVLTQNIPKKLCLNQSKVIIRLEATWLVPKWISFMISKALGIRRVWSFSSQALKNLAETGHSVPKDDLFLLNF